MGARWIVLIDDDSVAAEMYALGLEEAGFEVSALMEPSSFFITADAVPDAIVLDWNLPNGTGGDALMRLRRQSRTARTPVLILSNFEPDQVHGSDTVFETGAVAWLVKAKTTPAELAEKVRESLGAEAL